VAPWPEDESFIDTMSHCHLGDNKSDSTTQRWPSSRTFWVICCLTSMAPVNNKKASTI